LRRTVRLLFIGFLLGAAAVVFTWRASSPRVEATAESPRLGGRTTTTPSRPSSSPLPRLSPRPTERAESGVYRVERVVDGDTILVRDGDVLTTVRLIGVDTPETVHPRKPVERFGKEAAAFTKRTLENESVRLEFDNERFDRYGRLLAYVYRASDGLFVNEELIRQGYGHAYTRFPFRYLDRFRRLEAEARENGRGLWGDGSPEPPPPSRGEMVYVTPTGGKYHRRTCRLLHANAKPLPLDEARERYEPCSVCSPPR